jgi:outer membrane murein-binding lipoprotein Lpp
MKTLALLAAIALLPGCGLLGITAEDAAARVKALEDKYTAISTAVDYAAKYDDVRDAVVVLSAQIQAAQGEAARALADVVTFLGRENPTEADAKAALAALQKALGKLQEASEVALKIEPAFGTSRLPPEIKSMLAKLKAEADATIREIQETAARVEKIASVLVTIAKVGGGVAGGAGAGPTVLGIISLIGALGTAGATVAASAQQKKEAA